MKKCIFVTLILFFGNIIKAQDFDCYQITSDDIYMRYTASGYQEVINGNHSKAINESRKIANICAESELAKMVNSTVTRTVAIMNEESSGYSQKSIDTALVSSYKVFNNMKTVCQSETKLIDNIYVTHVTKEISLDNIGNMVSFNDKRDKKKFRKILKNNNKK